MTLVYFCLALTRIPVIILTLTGALHKRILVSFLSFYFLYILFNHLFTFDLFLLVDVKTEFWTHAQKHFCWQRKYYFVWMFSKAQKINKACWIKQKNLLQKHLIYSTCTVLTKSHLDPLSSGKLSKAVSLLPTAHFQLFYCALPNDQC